ncbi:MAG: hypothetical protein US74_C0002G0028 [Parcubacteria group bacterium GW2011_GWA2_38_13]|nr:MAG: hypothetical protein US74_C0002G0028 [Parcubacteria group bacterium GW2011_GWA2_38_13]
MKKNGHHIIFEGAELVGKSYVMSQVYDIVEAKYNATGNILDGCHWFNSDIGIFGTRFGKPCIEKYVEMLEILKEKNVLFEKFHISDIVYNRLRGNIAISYKSVEKKLLRLEAKIILCTIKEDESVFQKRIQDRLRLYPHYTRILKSPGWYIGQQRKYINEIKKTKLPHLIVDMTEIPNEKSSKDILRWIGEI